MSKKSRPWSRQQRRAIRKRTRSGVWRASCRPGGAFYEAYARYYEALMAPRPHPLMDYRAVALVYDSTGRPIDVLNWPPIPRSDGG